MTLCFGGKQNVLPTLKAENVDCLLFLLLLYIQITTTQPRFVNSGTPTLGEKK